MLSQINNDADTCRIYTRVSTQKQGFSGLGLDSQKQIATAKAKEQGLKIIEESTEVESGR